jgi:hypothetical protein
MFGTVRAGCVATVFVCVGDDEVGFGEDGGEGGLDPDMVERENLCDKTLGSVVMCRWREETCMRLRCCEVLKVKVCNTNLIISKKRGWSFVTGSVLKEYVWWGLV